MIIACFEQVWDYFAVLAFSTTSTSDLASPPPCKQEQQRTENPTSSLKTGEIVSVVPVHIYILLKLLLLQNEKELGCCCPVLSFSYSNKLNALACTIVALMHINI